MHFQLYRKISFFDIFDSSEKKARRSESLNIKFDFKLIKKQLKNNIPHVNDLA